MGMMGIAAENPDAYVDALSGWQRERVGMLRSAILAGANFEQSIKWTNLLFSFSGPCLVIRAEEHRVILAVFRGKRLLDLDLGLKVSGKFELANLIMNEETEIDPAVITRLAAMAAGLNEKFGDPTAKN